LIDEGGPVIQGRLLGFGIIEQWTTRRRGDMQDETNSMPYREDELDEETLFIVSQTFKALSDPTRLRILNLLSEHEYPVNEIAARLSLLQSTVSHQLRFLKNLRLVKYRREGTSLFYSIDDEHVVDLLRQAIGHARHH